MIKLKYIILFFSLGLIGILSCRKDPEVSSTTNSGVTINNGAKTTPFAIPIPSGLPQMQIPADNPETVEVFTLGRMLFYDSILSGNKRQSCGSCHHQENAFADYTYRQFSLGADGSTKGDRNAPAIFNKGFEPNGTPPTGGFFWDGRAMTLEAQALGPIQNPKEMNNTLDAAVKSLQASPVYPGLFQKAFGSSTITSQNLAKAIAQFVRSIVSGTTLYDSVVTHHPKLLPDFRTEAQKLGFILFFRDPDSNLVTHTRRNMAKSTDAPSGADCSHCHSSPLFTPEPRLTAFLNNGLTMTTNNGLDEQLLIKVPSLRNVALTAPYMHDGRFPNLDSVLNHYDHGDLAMNSPFLSDAMFYKRWGATVHKMNLTTTEKNALKAFLETLTDYSLASNSIYKNPFVK